MTILTIVPRLPPAVDGVGDYALNLARQLSKVKAIDTAFIVADPKWSNKQKVDEFCVYQISNRSYNDLFALLCKFDSTSVLLHYVGYGYATRGYPIWLFNALKSWVSLSSRHRLVIMFHELYATSYKPWTSSFWLSPLQQTLAKRLSRLSKRCITSRQGYGTILCHWNPGLEAKISVLPVFSNVGESVKRVLLADRTRRLVVFGHKDSRSLVYQRYQFELEQVCRELEITEICDIGISTGLKLSRLFSIPLTERGVMNSNEIGSLLSDSIAGFLAFPPPAYFAKSTIFAAYCAHGLIPVIPSYSKIEIDGLIVGKQYWSTKRQIQSLSLEIGQEIANEAHIWYQSHSLAIQASVYASCLLGNS